MDEGERDGPDPLPIAGASTAIGFGRFGSVFSMSVSQLGWVSGAEGGPVAVILGKLRQMVGAETQLRCPSLRSPRADGRRISRQARISGQFGAAEAPTCAVAESVSNSYITHDEHS